MILVIGRPDAYGEKDNIADLNPIYLEWGKTAKERQSNYRKDISEEIERLSLNLNARFIGPEDFISQMEDRFQVSNLKAEKGRPRK